jgi:hypothetical protein
MFEAWILVCVMSQAGECFAVQDTRGPYPSHEQCYERTIEMGVDVLTNIPGHKPINWRCVKIEGSMT